MLYRRARLSKMAVSDEYFDWLCWFVNIDNRSLTDGYSKLLKNLHFTSFYWFVPNDDNRAYEGMNLRERFCDELNIKYRIEDFPEECTMLELIIGLAIRCSDLANSGLSEAQWFWRLLDNCGLSYYDDDCMDDPYEIIERLIERRYKRNGQGGFFPIKTNRKDQTKIELWYQMSAYINENYYLR